MSSGSVSKGSSHNIFDAKNSNTNIASELSSVTKKKKDKGENSKETEKNKDDEAKERKEFPITIDPKCLSHQTPGHDTNLTLKLFKVACLLYKPSDVEYRGITVSRQGMVRIRRGFIDKIQNILPTCDLFKTNAIYPKRYFDDLMMENSHSAVGIRPAANMSPLQISQPFNSQSINTSPSGVKDLPPNVSGLNISNLHLNIKSAHFLPEVGQAMSQKRHHFVSNDSIEPTGAASTGQHFFKYKPKKRLVFGEVQSTKNRNHNQSMSIDVHNSYDFRRGPQQQIGQFSKQEIAPLMPFVRGFVSDKTRFRYNGNQSAANGLYSSIQLMPQPSPMMKQKPHEMASHMG